MNVLIAIKKLFSKLYKIYRTLFIILRFHRNMLFLKLFGKTTSTTFFKESQRQRKLTKTKSIDNN